MRISTYKWHLFSGIACLSVALSTNASAADSSLAANWYREPSLLQVGDRPLDTAEYDDSKLAHAAPFMADMDNDGKRDLVVGSYSGQFRLFWNSGTDAAPSFAMKDSRWLMAPGRTARVPIWCCTPSGPQLMDLDQDGILDLSSGSYAPGAFYWFKGAGDGTFSVRDMLLDHFGRPVYVYPRGIYITEEKVNSYAAHIAWGDLDDDGLPDMVVGNWAGDLLVKPQQQKSSGYLSENDPLFPSAPIVSQQARDTLEIRIGDSKAVPDRHSTPAVADWDGDGLLDILSGSASGAVYWFRNTGRRDAPQFNTREEILPQGRAVQWTTGDDQPQRGGRSHVQVIDYNRDGKLDLLLGAWSISQAPRPDLTATERKKMEMVRQELAALDAKAGFDFHKFRFQHEGYRDKYLSARLVELEKALSVYLIADTSGKNSQPSYINHGHVWVVLQQ